MGQGPIAENLASSGRVTRALDPRPLSPETGWQQQGLFASSGTFVMQIERVEGVVATPKGQLACSVPVTMTIR